MARSLCREIKYDIAGGSDGLSVGAWVLVLPPWLEQYSTCPICGGRISIVHDYCSFCGATLRSKIILKICPNCNSRNPALARFCNECGQKQDS